MPPSSSSPQQSTPSPSPTLSPSKSTLLDSQIAATLDSISALTHRQSTLSAYILSQPPPSLLTLLSTPTPPTPNTTTTSTIPEERLFPQETLTDLAAKSAALQASSRTATHRLSTSTTTFQIHDPRPGAQDGGFVLGVRIDVFSGESRSFGYSSGAANGSGGTYYLFLNRIPPAKKMGKAGSETGDDTRIDIDTDIARKGGGGWVLHRHTLPLFVPVKKLCERYLPFDLKGLVTALRRRVYSYQRREDAVVRMGRENASFVERVTVRDGEGRGGRVYLKDNTVVGVGEDGEGGGVVDVRFDEGGGVESVDARDGLGRRLYGLERKVLAAGRVERIRFGE